MILSGSPLGNGSGKVGDLFLGIRDGLVSSIRFFLLEFGLLLVTVFDSFLFGVFDRLSDVVNNVVTKFFNNWFDSIAGFIKDLSESDVDVGLERISVFCGSLECCVNLFFGLGLF